MRKPSRAFVGLYRLCLLAYPREFQSDCAAEMVETLRVREAEVGGQSGALAMLRFRFKELRAVVRTGLRLRLRRGPTLSSPPGSGEPRRRRGRGLLDSVTQDIRHTLRGSRKNPLVTTVAVATLGLGIGATTSIFSVIDGVLLRGLPYQEPERLVEILNTLPAADITFAAMDTEELESWRRQENLFERIEAYAEESFVVTEGDEPEHIEGSYATVGLMAFLGVQPQTGRGFAADDADAASIPVVIISDGMWRRRFGASPAALGELLTINYESHTIVGVMPRGFNFPYQQTELWIPLRDAPASDDQSSITVRALARMLPGMHLARARELAEAFHQGMQEQGMRPEHWGIELRAKNDDRASRETRTSLYVVSGAVAFVLLIACANIANLALARATSRRRELTLRAALGANRFRIARQVLTESVIVGLLGGALGVVLAYWLLGAIVRLAPADLTVLNDSAIRMDFRVLGFAVGVSLMAGVASGLIPAIRGSRPSAEQALARADRSSPGGSRSRLRGALVVGEVALSLVLLIGAGLMVGSFARLRSIDPGFDTKNLLVVDLELDEGRYPTGVERRTFFDELTEMVSGLPGAESVAVAIGVPPHGGFVEVGTNPQVEGRPTDVEASMFMIRATVAPDYFRTMRIQIQKGRTFLPEDYAEESSVVIINEALARRYWGDDNPVGGRFRMSEEQPWLTVLGVAGDVKRMGLDDEFGELEVYYPLTAADEEEARRSLVVRVAGDPLALIPAVKSQIWTLDAGLPIDRISGIEQLFSESLAAPRFYLLLMSGFALVAGALAAVGIYGVTAYTVGQRTHEIGVRVALGAQRRDVLGLVVGKGMAQVLVGIVLGLAGALALSRLLTSMLFEVEPTDPATFAGVSLLLAVVALVACYIPARRAMRADPLEALRDH